MSDNQLQRKQEDFEQEFLSYVFDWEATNHHKLQAEYTNPKAIIQEMIRWENKLALDPAVSQDAAHLYQRGFSDGIASIEAML